MDKKAYFPLSMQWTAWATGLFLLLWNAALAQQTSAEKWTAQQLAKANTAQEEKGLKEEEKKVIQLTNLIRLDGALFARTYLQEYIALKKLDPKNKYVTSLIADLKRVKDLPMLVPNDKLFQAALFHAKDMGSKGKTGHTSSDGTESFDRIKRFLKPTGNYVLAENCYYGFPDAFTIVMQLLIDEGVQNLGHRKNMLSPRFQQVGVAIREHKTYRNNCVQDFAGG